MLGATVHTIGGLANGFVNGDEWECECIQIYVTLSRTWQVADLSEEDASSFRAAWGSSAVQKVVAHVPYLVNLASADEALRRKSLGRLGKEIARTGQLNVPLLVLHPGSYVEGERADGIVRLVQALNGVSESLRQSKTKILLETMAGQGTGLGSSFEELADVLSRLEDPDLFGVCFDSAHVFEAGYDMRGYDGYQRVVDSFDKTVGLGQIGAIHLNDSKTDLGSRKDRHAFVGEGKMGLEVFHALLRDERLIEIPQLLEPPSGESGCAESLAMLRRLREKSGSIDEFYAPAKALSFGELPVETGPSR